MALLIRGARCIDPAAGLDATADLLVADRRIAALGPGLVAPAGADVVNGQGLVLCPGLIDAGVFRADVAAAKAGGVTTVVLMPDQSPPLDDPALVERAQRIGKPSLWVRPLAAATRALAGRELGELLLLKEAGAVAVATGRHAVQNAQVMLRLLRYAAGLGLVVMVHGECPELTAGAVATEGEVATWLGLPAAPASAEALQIGRDLLLAREAGAALHIACVSTRGGIERIREAQRLGQDVTAATSPAYALLSDTALPGYRSFAHLSPPLRSEDDRHAVIEALADGTITMLGSRHDPRTEEEKRLPFANSEPGAAGTATLLALGLSLVHAGKLSLSRLIELCATAPARRFGLAGGTLAVGAPADLLLFDPEAPWRISADRLPGLSGNTPFDGVPVQGKVRLLLKGGERLV